VAERASILMLFTGGTISMKIVPGRGAVPARGGREILAAVPGIDAVARVDCEDFDRLPGPHWTPDRVLRLARHLDERLESTEHVGAVVTHGTDTLEESAYIHHLLVRTSKPIVLTGAMRTADDPVWDGPGNLLAASRTVTTPDAAGRGVLVVLDDTIHAAREVAKTHTESFAAFTSIGGGPIGIVDVDGVHFARPPGRPDPIATDRLEAEVALVPTALGTDDRWLRHAVETGARGLVLEAMGRGNVPPGMLGGVQSACAAGIPVVVASRCRSGRTAPRYAYEGGGATLREAGAIFSGDLTAPKARVKLMVLLGAGRSLAQIRDAFEGPGADAC